MGARVLTMDGGERAISEEQLAALDAELRGDLLLPESDGYEAARTIWNAMIDRRPALVARCAGPADVIRAVKFASYNELLVAVRGAGHNIAGKGVCDGGFLIDLSGLRSVHVDPVRRVASVDPGATLGDLDDETQLYGMAVPTGINSTTGIAGLTLGGGFGWLSRKHGLTVDNLRSARVVTANGEMLTASEDQNPDLFWGIRGGGGNFGVATSFEFDLVDIGPEVLSGLVVHPLSDAADLVRFYRDYADGLPADLNVWLVLRKAPPMPFLPPQVHGTEVAILAAIYSGEMSEGERLLKPLRDYGDPIADVISPHTFLAWQKAFDPLLTPGARNYWKSHNFLELSDGLLDTALDYTARLPSDQTEIFFGRLGGAVNEVATDATAYPHRDAEYVMNVHARWEDPADDEACIGWARSYFNDTEKYATGGVYVNFVPDGEAPIDAAYGPNYERLVALKRKYDPTNLFRFNQNIAP